MKVVSALFYGLCIASSFSSHAFNDEKSDLEAKELGCGIINLGNYPPRTKDLHFATINSIDGQTVSSNSKSFKLSEGKHIIKVIENIRENSLTRRRGEAKNFHFIEFNVEANKRYSLGAQYIRENKSKFKTGEYWVPKVWKTSDKKCRL